MLEGNFFQGSNVQPNFERGKKSVSVGKTGGAWGAAAGVSALASTWSCTAAFSAEFLESGFPFRQSAEC